MVQAGMRRRLLWHGVLLFLLGLLVGIAVPAFRNPRMGLTAHVGTVLSGIVLWLAGAAWDELRLSARATAATFWSGLFANYVNAAALVAAAMLGTSRSTPIAGAGFAGTAVQEAMVDALLYGGAVVTFAWCGLLLWAFRGRE